MRKGIRTTPDTASADDSAILSVLDAVRTNCHISDARHAGDYTLCVYLLKMREYYRWEQNIPYEAALPHGDVTRWLTEREAHWDSLDEQPFLQLPIDGEFVDPFDTDAINDRLNTLGYVYSSGYGRGMKPVFFLGELERHEIKEDFTLLVSGRELARDLAAPPAMSRDGTIFIRRESLRRMIWEKVEEWRWNKPDNAMKTALACFDFREQPDQALDEMTAMALEGVMLHEIGEVLAGRILGPAWQEMLVSIGQGKAEIMARAVRDNLADALSTLPGLLEAADPAALHFYIAGLGNMRRELFPALVSAYETWSASGDLTPLQETCTRAGPHWQQLASALLDIYNSDPDDCQQALVNCIEQNTL